MSRLRRKPRYILRARTVGLKTWTCVLCGAVNRSNVTARTFKLRCSQRSCRARFAFGEVFYLLPGGGHIAPPSDRIIAARIQSLPVDSLPVGVLAGEKYRSGRAVNRLVIGE